MKEMTKNKLLAFVIVLSMTLAMAAVPTSAAIVDSGTCGENLTWTLDDNGTLTISGTGAMANHVEFPPENPWGASYNIERVVIQDGVSTICDYAFLVSYRLTSIEISDSVTSIGDYAFGGCYNLTSITIPDSVTSIGDSAFSGCESLTSITIPDSVTSIGDYAFSGCESLTSITIPDSVTTIGGDAFGSCFGLTSITIPEGVTSIGGCAFQCCSLTSIKIPGSVTSIGAYAFHHCDNLTSITIGSGVTSIGAYAFYLCENLTSVTIPDSVTSIGGWAFSGCSNLTDVYYGGSENDWDSYGIGNDHVFNGYDFTYDDSLINATIHYNCVFANKLTKPYDNNGEIVTLPEGNVLDTGENLNFRNGYVNTGNGYVKAGDKKITGSNIHFTVSGKMKLDAGETAKVEKDNGDGTTDQGFIVGLLNPTGIIRMILSVSGTANGKKYTGRTITKDFDFTDSEISGLVNFGFEVKRVPKPLELAIQSIE